MSSPVTTPLTYNGYVSQIATLAVVQTTTSGSLVVGVDAAFNAILPQMLNYAELRIQRDLDLLPSLTSSSSFSTTPGSNQVSIDANAFVAIKTIGVVSGTQNIQLLPVSTEYLQSVWFDTSAQGTPVCFAMIGGDQSTYGQTSNIIQLGPTPDQAYPIIVRGIQRMQTLYVTTGSGTNTTFISEYYPDLLIMASMVYISGFQRNFGRMSDDPQMAVSYESQYQALLEGATVEEARKKFQGSAWTANKPPAIATPNR
jgi:hypothetical protein